MVLMYAAAGEVMVGLSSSYRATGRSEDALAMNEKALALLRRTLPRNHPNLGARPQFIVFIVAGLSYIADVLFYQHLRFGRLPRRCARQVGWRMR
jgi:hypothetical protein